MVRTSSLPDVSVIITTYNRSNLLADAINSVLSQTYSNYELLIVDDASTDATSNLVASYHSEKLRYIRHETNQGLASARNTGLHNAQGKFIAYLDDDDLWHPSKLEKQISLWKLHSNHPHLVIYCAPAVSLKNGEIITDHIPTARGAMADFIYEGYLIPQSCLLLLKTDLLNIGGHSEDLVSCIDHDLWMKLAQAGFQMDFVPEGLVLPNPNECDHSRMTKQLDKRLDGIKQFFTKWKSTVIAARGLNSWYKIEELYYCRTLYTIKDQAQNRTIDQLSAMNYLRRLVSLQSRYLFWLDSYLFQFGLLQLIPVHKMTKRIPGYPLRAVKRWKGLNTK